MNELISIGQSVIASNEVKTANARELHNFLGGAQEFRHWIKDRIESYGFVQEVDFVTTEKINRGGKSTEYHISLDMAKELAMVERTRKGKEARQYFIDCERRALVAPAFAVPSTLSGALRLAAEQADTIEAQALQIAAAAPAVQFVDKYVDSTGLKGFRQVCKLLNASEPEFREFLKSKKIMYPLGGEWAPFAQHIDAGRFAVKAGTSDTNGHAFNSAKFTPKGVNWVAGEWAKHKLESQLEAAL